MSGVLPSAARRTSVATWQREAAPGPSAQHLIAQEVTTHQDFSFIREMLDLGRLNLAWSELLRSVLDSELRELLVQFSNTALPEV